jgi:hypothetical protein
LAVWEDEISKENLENLVELPSASGDIDNPLSADRGVLKDANIQISVLPLDLALSHGFNTAGDTNLSNSSLPTTSQSLTLTAVTDNVNSASVTSQRTSGEAKLGHHKLIKGSPVGPSRAPGGQKFRTPFKTGSVKPADRTIAQHPPTANPVNSNQILSNSCAKPHPTTQTTRKCFD